MASDPRSGIEQTIHRYAWGFDQFEIAALAGCFTEDAELVSAAGSVIGRDAIAAAMTERRRARADAGEQTRHVTTNVVVDECDEATAVVRSYFLLTVAKDGGLSMAAAGWYHDRFVEREGEWLITRRETHSDL